MKNEEEKERRLALITLLQSEFAKIRASGVELPFKMCSVQDIYGRYLSRFKQKLSEVVKWKKDNGVPPRVRKSFKTGSSFG